MAHSKHIADILHDYRQETMHYRQSYETKLAADPLVRQYTDRIGELGLMKLGRAVRGEDTAQLDLRLADLEHRRKSRLAGLGLRPYQCSVCHDTGYANGDFCVCMRRRIYTDYYGAPDLSEPGRTLREYPYDVLDGKNILPTLGASARELTRFGVQAFQELLRSAPGSRRGLLLYGKVGVGKTHLVRAGAHEAAMQGMDVLFLHAADLHNLYWKQRVGGEINLHYLETSELLIVDDLGTEPMTRNVTCELLSHLLETRHEQKLPTVFTTNLSELQRVYGERISSRLYDPGSFTFIQLGGADLRTGRQHEEQKDRSQVDSGQRRNVPFF